MIFISIFLTIVFSVLKLAGLVDWPWLLVVGPIALDIFLLAGAKAIGKHSYVSLVLCSPLNITRVMRSAMTRRA